MPTTDKSPNRLINEKSPYLLQHAHNPVEWYPWGEEAFAKAKTEDKPVFLSIGYSTCHWCHVMERESFEDEEVARALNAGLVAVKVDREERPDVDHIYMAVCQALTGAGGWPLTVIMTPEKKPFFAGTYFPKQSKWGRPGLMDILAAVSKQWRENRQKLSESGEEITRAIQGRGAFSAGDVSTDLLDTAYNQLERVFDRYYGGFGSAPKFPAPHQLMFLLRHWRRTGEKKALAMVEKTLDAMRRGGIYDQLGFGFARYSVDEFWMVPHFEKMLYDNALLCYAYLEAYQCTANPDFAQVAKEIIQYVLRDMTSPEGGFYSAEDADSEGVEGKFYVWTRSEVLATLGPERGTLFADFYGVAAEGACEGGANTLNFITHDLNEFAAQSHVEPAELARVLAECRETLYQLREKRIRPFKDDKILTAWNALMIAALAKAARVLGEPGYAAAAERAMKFIFTQMLDSDGRLLARYRDGEAGCAAYLDDHAFLLWALLEVYESTFSPDYINKALNIASVMQRLFWDNEQGGFYFSGADGEVLIARSKELYDGAMPSGNSLAALALLRLARMTNQTELAELAETTVKTFSGQVAEHPQAYTGFLLAVDLYFEAPRQVIVAGGRGDKTVRDMLELLGTRFLPTTSVLLNDSDNADNVAAVLPQVAAELPVNGAATAFICENFACQLPVGDLDSLRHML